MVEYSALQPVDPATVEHDENEKAAPWIMRKLTASLTGRIVMSTLESFKATGVTVICLSPWGDSSPLILPCIRFRDIVLHTAIAATGGTAAIAAPIMGPIAESALGAFGDTIAVEIGTHVGFELGVKVADDLLIEHPIDRALPLHSKRLVTTSIKTLLITLKYKITMTDAVLGFFRSSVHHGTASESLFSGIANFISIDKGWFNPYLFASGRRPVIPRSMNPDVVFCHGPFLQGDYRIAQTLLGESASVISLCKAPDPEVEKTRKPTRLSTIFSGLSIGKSDPPTPSPPPPAEPSTPPAVNVDRRMIILVLGISPHRTLWTTSARPEESVLNYHLLNGCPTVVIPIKPGCPLIAWDTLTLAELHKKGKKIEGPKFQGVVNVLFEYASLCVDWDRVVFPEQVEKAEGAPQETIPSTETAKDPVALLKRKEEVIKDAITLLVVGAIQSYDSSEVKKKLDLDRAGIVMFRLP